MTNYAYKDEKGILHVHSERRIAEQYGAVVETELQPDVSGFPVVEGKGTILYDDGRAFVDGNVGDGREILAPKVLTDLAAQL